MKHSGGSIMLRVTLSVLLASMTNAIFTQSVNFVGLYIHKDGQIRTKSIELNSN